MEINHNLELELISIIVNFGLGSKLLHKAKKHGALGGTIALAKGTSNRGIWEFLGLSDIRKEIVYIMSDKDTAEDIIKNLDKEYNFFIPDLRNSGKSDVARTKMGYCFGQDIFHTMEMLNEKFGKNNFTLYGFSQGGMGSAIASKMYIKTLRKKGIIIEKLILDSSISNIRKRIKEDARKRRVPKFIVSVIVRIFNLRVGSHLDKLKLSYLLKRIPTLIIQSKNDKATTYGMLMEEYNELAQNENIKLKVFEKGSHTRIYADPECKDEYAEAVKEFLTN